VISQAAQDVLAERERQQTVEGWTPEHDAMHAPGTLAAAAVCYAVDSVGGADRRVFDTKEDCLRYIWPWDRSWWKPKDERRNLVKAGALILAEIERLDRLAAQSPLQTGALT
jgi:hypothetical protein